MNTPAPRVHPDALSAKCAAYNRANAEANRLAPLYLAALAPFVGAQIVKADGALLAKVKKAVDGIAPAFVADGYRTPSAWLSTGHGYNLTLTVKTQESSPGSNSRPGDDYQIASYAEVTVYLADLRDGVLLKLTPRDPLPTDYAPERVRELRKMHEDAKRAASVAQSALYPFGEYDR